MGKVKLAILGFGQRGIVYANEAKKYPDEIELVAVCEINKKKHNLIKEEYGIDFDNIYSNYEEFISQGKIADILIISTMDRDHYKQTMDALDVGYDILLEKPIATSFEEVYKIKEKANKLNRKIAVAHVLRYTPFYQKIHEIIEDGLIGEVVTLSQNENIGYEHYAHSYVRGNWRNSHETGPIILTKSSHDLDIIKFIMNKRVSKISSFGNLMHFKKENKPKDLNEENDIFSPYKFYSKNPRWMKLFTLETDVNKVLSDPNLSYGKSVYESDNNVVDHQIVNLLFENGATANFKLTAFSHKTYRTIQINGTKGEIVGQLEESKISLYVFGKDKVEIDLRKTHDDFSYHQGGDKRLLYDFVLAVKNNETNFFTNINNSVESHFLAFAAEESRLNDGKVIDVSKDWELFNK